tara:strand:- start:2812 stop:3627 length:816 start_codon:yes stop_codon:yes gene_type:complete
MDFIREKHDSIETESQIILFYKEKLFYNKLNKSFTHNYKDLDIFIENRNLIGIYANNENSIYVSEITDYEIANQLKLLNDSDFIDLRYILGLLDSNEFSVISRGKKILFWQSNNRFCGSCGQPTLYSNEEGAFFCNCNKQFIYPAIAPCIITLIHRDNEILLGRNSLFPEGMYSTLAGFIEAGENCEEALIREVNEEVGIKVHNIRYFGSQSWPFPSQLMLGFITEYQSGDISLNDQELEDAKWFDINDLPNIPPIESISGQLIHSYIEDH